LSPTEQRREFCSREDARLDHGLNDFKIETEVPESWEPPSSNLVVITMVVRLILEN
jgi:hypothetical protein